MPKENSRESMMNNLFFVCDLEKLEEGNASGQGVNLILHRDELTADPVKNHDFSQVKSLTLQHVTSELMCQMAAAAPAVQYLALKHGTLCAEGYAALGALSLTRLSLGWLEMRVPELNIVLDSIKPGLQALSLGENRIGDKGCALLSDHPALAALRELEVDSNRIRVKGALHLANAPGLNALERLGIGYNSVRAEGAVALLNSSALANLNDLGLYQNRIGDEGAAAIAQTSPHRVQVLNLGSNKFTPDGIVALGKASFPNLRRLLLHANRVDAIGAQAIVLSSWGPQLESLTLRDRDLKENAGAIIAGAQSMHDDVRRSFGG